MARYEYANSEDQVQVIYYVLLIQNVTNATKVLDIHHIPKELTERYKHIESTVYLVFK